MFVFVSLSGKQGLNLFAGQVIITTYQTLNMDFVVPKNIDSDEEDEWVLNNGYAQRVQRRSLTSHYLIEDHLQG